MRLLAAGSSLRRSSGDVGNVGHRDRRGRGKHEPGSDVLEFRASCEGRARTGAAEQHGRAALCSKGIQPVLRGPDGRRQIRLHARRSRCLALGSHRRASAATKAEAFEREVVSIGVMGAEGPESHATDERTWHDATLEGVSSVKRLEEGGSISTANASQICDGASGVLVVNETALKAHGLTPIARIHSMTVTAGDPARGADPCDAARAGAGRNAYRGH